MKLKEYDILIDLKKHKQIEDIEVVAGDFGSNILNINIVEGLEIYELTGLNVEIAFAKSDGTTVLQDLSNGIELMGNKIKCTLKTNTIASPGKLLAEVRISEGLKLLTTARFNFNVRKAIVDDETIESTNEYPILNGLISDVNGLIDEIQGKPELRGYSAYEVWLNNGNIGTIDDYLASLIGERGLQGEQGIQGIQGIQGERGIDGDGDMNKAVYDTNDNGKVDIAENAEKLNGIPATDYATRAYTDEQIGLITETGIPKYLEYEYKIIGLIGQSKFDIPLETFDSNTDSIDLFVNTTYWERTKYTITNKTGVILGFITLNTPLEEDKNIVIKVKKNVPMGAEGSTSGNVLADGSVEDRKLTDKTVDDTIIPPSDTNTGKLGDVLNWFGNMFKNITGKSSWKDKPTKNLEELNNDLSSHEADKVNPHKVTLDQINAMNALAFYVTDNDYNLTIKPGWYSAGQLSENAPPGNGMYGALLVQVRGIDIHQISIFGSEIYARIYSGGTSKWSEWVMLLTNKPIPLIDATLKNGWINNSSYGALKYFKDPFGMVHISGEIQDGIITNSTVITNLPVGYRPRHTTPIPVQKSNDGNLAMFSVASNGDLVVIGNYTSGAYRINGSFKAT